MLKAIILSSVIGFLVTSIITPKIIKYLVRMKMLVRDMNKKDKPLVPISGGLAVAIGLFIGLMSFIFAHTFLNHGGATDLIGLFAAIATILLVTFIGFIDDLTVRLDKEDAYIGLKQWQKPLLTFFAVIPLMVINAGVSNIMLPGIRRVYLGLLYPLVIVPIGFIGATNMVNLLEGYNGIATGMGIVYTGMLGLFAYTHGSYTASLIAFVTFGCLLAFYRYNKYPARVLPGNTLTYLLGGVIATIAIIGNIEKAALIVSIPFFIEFILKMRGKLKKQSYGVYYKDGKVKSIYKKIYSIPHIFARTGKFTEKQITWFMILIALFFSLLIWVATPIENYIIVNFL